MPFIWDMSRMWPADNFHSENFQKIGLLRNSWGILFKILSLSHLKHISNKLNASWMPVECCYAKLKLPCPKQERSYCLEFSTNADCMLSKQTSLKLKCSNQSSHWREFLVEVCFRKLSTALFLSCSSLNELLDVKLSFHQDRKKATSWRLSFIKWLLRRNEEHKSTVRLGKLERETRSDCVS